jgi:hypothetical protein
MGYYDNPPIITPQRDNSAAYIADAGRSIGESLARVGERKRQEEKEERLYRRQQEREQKLTLDKLKDRKNKLDLYYNDKYSTWKSKQPEIQHDVNNQIQSIIQGEIVTAADNRLLLENESNQEKRSEYLKSITNADLLLENSGTFAKNLTGQVASYRLKTPANKLGEIGGSIVNGRDKKQILNNTAVLEILGGNSAFVKDSSINVTKNETGDGLLLTVSGHHKDSGEFFSVPIDSNIFNKTDEESDNGLLIPIEGNDAFINNAKKTFFDEKENNILPGFLEDTHETYDLTSLGNSGGNGKDIYQIHDGQRVRTEIIQNNIRDKAVIAANGLLATYDNKPAKMRAFLNYTLKQGVEFYDKSFANESVDNKKKILTDLMTKDAMDAITKKLYKTENAKDGTIYWNPSPNISMKQKSSTNSDQDKQDEIPYQATYYDNIIKGSGAGKNKNYTPGQVDFRDRRELVTQVNNLAGESGKYITKEDLYDKYLEQPYMSGKYDTGLTIAEAYKKGKLKTDPKKLFSKAFGDSKIYMKKGEGAYKPVTGYNFGKAYDRVRFALDQTAGEGEKKKLQGKLTEARLEDLRVWTEKNPRGNEESLEQYKARYQRSN